MKKAQSGYERLFVFEVWLSLGYVLGFGTCFCFCFGFGSCLCLGRVLVLVPFMGLFLVWVLIGVKSWSRHCLGLAKGFVQWMESLFEVVTDGGLGDWVLKLMNAPAKDRAVQLKRRDRVN